MNDSIALAHPRFLAGNRCVVHQVAEIQRILARWGQNHNVTTRVGFFLTQKRNAFSNLLGRLARSGKKQIPLPQSLALLCNLLWNEGMEFPDVIVVTSVNLTVANAWNPVG